MTISDIRCLKVRNDTMTQQLVSQTAQKRHENLCFSEIIMKQDGMKKLRHEMSNAETE